jgi:uncharacterized heparinase superfamily protein
LNESIEYDKQIEWQAPSKSRLWRYNLHYFNYLQSKDILDKQTGIDFLKNWVENNPPGTKDSWDPFPLSLRIVNWIKYLSQTSHQGLEISVIAKSIYQQVLWLERFLERHLLGNHFFKNLKALVFAGLFFHGKDAERWLKKGRYLLIREINEQILPDGGHFERSPMYHSMILEDCLDLLNAVNERSSRECEEFKALLSLVCPRMVRFLAGMLHPDGEIALFNDAAFGIELSAKSLFEYAAPLIQEHTEKLRPLSRSFPESGYFVIAPRKGDHMIIDCGPIGPDYQPGHAHCDTLSYELSIDGKRVIVDSGVHDYEKSHMRNYVRSTRAHNTIMVDGEEQSEIWGAFRVARRAKPLFAGIEKYGGDRVRFHGAHDGYTRLPGTVIHERIVDVDKLGEWTIRDRLKGKSSHRVDSFIHVHPELKALPQGNEIQLCDRGSGEKKATIVTEDRDSVRLEKGFYCPEFGLKMQNDVVILSRSNSLPFEMVYKILSK